MRSRSPCHVPSFGRGCTARVYSKNVAPDRRTLRTVFRDTFSSRMISLIGLPLTKCSRLIRPIVSTTSIPRHPLGIPSGAACPPQQIGGQSWTTITPLQGSIFHAGSHPALPNPSDPGFDPPYDTSYGAL